ncbi:VWA domain-containing protein, partial [candidate division KSB1 bacterium]|nr:VWA domain-containing protein [candidate division KSB1 bacterium]
MSCRLARNAALVVLFTCLLAGAALGQTGNVVVSVNNISIAGETSLRGLTGAFPYPVLSTISVTDQAGNVVTGLADTARFLGPAEIAEIGAPVSQIWQPLLEYHRDNPAFPANQNLFNQTPQPSFTEVRRTTYFPTSTMLVMDISGSMKPQLEEAKASNLAYLEQLRSYDRAGLIQFCASVVNTLPISSDLSTLRQEIVAADTCTGTAIENALLAALEVIRHETTRRGIIIYTDGQNFPFTEPTPGPVIAMAQEFNIPIFTIALGDQTREDILELIAEQTGGLFFSAETAADMVEIYEKIAVVIQNFYVMAHASPDPIRNDTWRVVDVTGGTLSNRDRGLGHYFVANQSSSRVTDLALSLTANTETARPGDTFEYLLRLSNSGPSEGRGLDLKQHLPDSVRFLSAIPAPVFGRGDSLFWQIPALAAGNTFDIRVSVQLSPQTPSTLTELISHARLSAANDSSPDNNFASDTVRVIFTPPPNNTELAFSISSQTQVPGEARTGEAYSYHIQFNNLGAHAAQNIRVAQLLPDSVRFLSSIPASSINGDSLIWQIAAIGAGMQDSIIVNVQLAANVPPTLTQLISFANFTADNDTTLANNFDTDTLRVISLPPLGIVDLEFSLTSQTQVPGAVRTGEVFSYKIKFNNPYPKSAENIRVAQLLPDSVRFLSSIPASSINGDSLIWQIAAIDAGAQDSIIVNVQLAANV